MRTLLFSLLFLSCGLAQEWRQEQSFRWKEVLPSDNGSPGFTLLTGSQTGIRFTNNLPQQRWLTNSMLLNGSGIAAGDLDGDGLCDLYFCNLTGTNSLYRNLGHWKFEDIALAAGVGLAGEFSAGAALADLDGDGDLDLAVTTFGNGVQWFFNDGKGRFTKRVTSARPGLRKAGTSLALADIDHDGDLDIYVTNYRLETIRDHPETAVKIQQVAGVPRITEVNGMSNTNGELAGRFTISPNGQLEEHGEEDLLLINDGRGNFSAASFTDGRFLDEEGFPLKEPPHDWGLSVMFHDINRDGWPDLYVCNDFNAPDRIWINQGKGRFRAAPFPSFRNTSLYSMGIDFADVNRDGFDDLFVVDMLSPDDARRHNQVGNLRETHLKIGDLQARPQYSRNTLFLNRGDASFAQVSEFFGLHGTEWSWCPVFLDVDLDGYEDLIIATGHEIDAMNVDVTRRIESIRSNRNLSPSETLKLRGSYPRLDLPNVAFHNIQGRAFQPVGNMWGFTNRAVSHGIATADLDNDGDMDLVVNNLNGEASVYRNNTSAPRVQIRLNGRESTSHGIGARISLVSSHLKQSQEMIAGGRYQSSDAPARTFAALDQKMTLEIAWPSGRLTKTPEILPNRIYEFEEVHSSPPEEPRSAPPLFEDKSDLLAHVHHEEPFNDFERQPLLPFALSQGGPGVTWHDVDGDGRDDLIVGSGRGGTLTMFKTTERGFERVRSPILDRKLARDQTTILALDRTLLAGSSNYEDGSTNGGWIRIYDLNRGVSGESIPGQLGAVGPLCAADVDGDGSLDLFLGGRAVPGKFPFPADSLLMRNDNGRFTLLQRFEKIGLVSGAIFSDLDNDGVPELLLASSWGPVRLFEWKERHYVERTKEWGLEGINGLWNGITTADVDGDGLLDLLVSNWGLNNPCRASPEHPLKLFYGDCGGGSPLDILESYYSAQMGKDVPVRHLQAIRNAMPALAEAFQSYESYGKAGIADLLGGHRIPPALLRVTTLESMLFLNRTNRFLPQPLPSEAQLAPAFAINAADFDGDGCEDLFLGQNFFATRPETPRFDAGCGLLLRGDGHGHFTSLSLEKSGIKIHGEQRGAAMSDYDNDGRVDLAVSQNGAPTRLLHNTTARPGLIVHVKGPPGNEDSIGSVLRAESGMARGPTVEIRIGEGYWSQNSSKVVLTVPAESPPSRISLRRPRGALTSFLIPHGAQEVEISPEGQLKVLR